MKIRTILGADVRILILILIHLVLSGCNSSDNSLNNPGGGLPKPPGSMQEGTSDQSPGGVSGGGGVSDGGVSGGGGIGGVGGANASLEDYLKITQFRCTARLTDRDQALKESIATTEIIFAHSDIDPVQLSVEYTIPPAAWIAASTNTPNFPMPRFLEQHRIRLQLIETVVGSGAFIEVEAGLAPSLPGDFKTSIGITRAKLIGQPVTAVSRTANIENELVKLRITCRPEPIPRPGTLAK